MTDVSFIVVNNNASILAVGWDKHVNVFKDDQERMKQVCLPEDRFGGDETSAGHQDDILCIAKSRGDLIATGDYGGTTIVWNMSSKKIFATLKSDLDIKQGGEGKVSILTVYFDIDRFFCIRKSERSSNQSSCVH